MNREGVAATSAWRHLIPALPAFSRKQQLGSQDQTSYQRELACLLAACEDEPAHVRRDVGSLKRSAWWV